jgi:3-mercaptopyruvate sulfurtransferase SseA
MLYQMGWRNQRVLEEGLPGWIEKGYPVDGRNPAAPPAH